MIPYWPSLARNSSLATMNLPAALESAQQQQQQPMTGGVVVPPHLLEHSQRIQSQGGLAKLETMMKDVRRISSVNRKLVQEVSGACFPSSAEQKLFPPARRESGLDMTNPFPPRPRNANRAETCSTAKPKPTRPTARGTALHGGLVPPRPKQPRRCSSEWNSSKRSSLLLVRVTGSSAPNMENGNRRWRCSIGDRCVSTTT